MVTEPYTAWFIHIKSSLYNTMCHRNWSVSGHRSRGDCGSTTSDTAVGVEVCKHSFIMLHEGGLGGGNNVDELDNTLTLDLNPPGLDSCALLSNFLISFLTL